MEAQVTAQARRAVSLRQRPRKYRQLRASPVRPSPTHPCLLQDSGPGAAPGGTTPTGPPLPPGQYTTSGGDSPTTLKLRAPWKADGDMDRTVFWEL